MSGGDLGKGVGEVRLSGSRRSVSIMVERAAAWRGAGDVHQHVDRAEGGLGTVLEAIHLIDLADIGRYGDQLGVG
jgi:hypothetical protein